MRYKSNFDDMEFSEAHISSIFCIEFLRLLRCLLATSLSHASQSLLSLFEFECSQRGYDSCVRQHGSSCMMILL